MYYVDYQTATRDLQHWLPSFTMTDDGGLGPFYANQGDMRMVASGRGGLYWEAYDSNTLVDRNIKTATIKGMRQVIIISPEII